MDPSSRTSDSGAELDIVKIRHGHAWPPRNDEVIHTIVMEEEWASDALDTQSLGMCFDLDRDTDVDRCLFIKRNTDGSLYGYLEGTTVFRGYARVWRPDDFSVKVRFPLRLLKDRKVTFYRWRAQLHEIDGDNCVESHDCGDVAPNDGFITHRLG